MPKSKVIIVEGNQRKFLRLKILLIIYLIYLLYKYRFDIRDAASGYFGLLTNFTTVIATAVLSLNRYQLVGLIVLIWLSTRYNLVYYGTSEIKYRVFPPSWEVSILMDVTSMIETDTPADFTEFLKRNKSTTLGYQIFFDHEAISFRVQLRKRRLLVPILPNSLRNQLIGLLRMSNFGYRKSSFSKRKHTTSFSLMVTDFIPNSTDLVKSMKSIPNCIISIGFQYKKIKIDPSVTSEKIDFTFHPDRKQISTESVPYRSQDQEDYFEFTIKFWFDTSEPFITQQAISVLQTNGIEIKGLFSHRSANIIKANQAKFLMFFPQIPSLITPASQLFYAPKYKIPPESSIGRVLLNNQPTTPFGISARDFKRGGIITGMIGCGKTTMRLHILETLLRKKIRIIDFDIKGDAPKFKMLGRQGKILVPKLNFHMNPFICPHGYSKREYAEIISQTMMETLPDAQALTPPQIHLLTRAIHLTVESNGNTRILFRNIIVLSHMEKQVIDNHQDSTAHALLTKLSWLQSLMGEIFWREGNTLSEKDFREENLFFDLSKIKINSPIVQIRFLINLIMTRVVASLKDSGQYADRNLPSLLVFIDEAQLLMPKNDNRELSRLEEIVTTLRYKGVSVIAAGVSPEIMSHVLMDTGFVAQYRSESLFLARSLGLTRENNEIINRLPDFTTIINTMSTNQKPVHIKVNNFRLRQDSDIVY
ncbi:MAG: hypothetical protein IH840_11545 [Candidatus Heimdallarchaeota archaeon]|nr:hypothetical protein [Candidatus Heimdallarchaeota archaeon]